MKKVRSFVAATVAAAAVGGVALAAQAETAGPVTDEKGVVQIPEGQPIFIGGYWVISGPDTALGLDQQRAVEVAIEDRGGGPASRSMTGGACVPARRHE